jgi:hypothetical protein
MYQSSDYEPRMLHYITSKNLAITLIKIKYNQRYVPKCMKFHICKSDKTYTNA